MLNLSGSITVIWWIAHDIRDQMDCTRLYEIQILAEGPEIVNGCII